MPVSHPNVKAHTHTQNINRQMAGEIEGERERGKRKICGVCSAVFECPVEEQFV